MAATAQVFKTIDPATGEVIAEVPDATAADVDAAVATFGHQGLREMGKDAIDLYTEVKSVWVSLT